MVVQYKEDAHTSCSLCKIPASAAARCIGMTFLGWSFALSREGHLVEILIDTLLRLVTKQYFTGLQ